MELTIKPSNKNHYPLAGILIKGFDSQQWAWQLQQMQISLSALQVYSIPDTIPNSIWGCLVVYSFEKSKIDIGRNNYCQLVNNLLFIPEKTSIYPSISSNEIDTLLQGKRHILHPEFGLFALDEVLDWATILRPPIENVVQLIRPADSVFIPKEIKSFQINPVATEDVLGNLEEKVFPKREYLEEKPLSLLEKAKLTVYEKLFSKSDAGVNPSPLLSKIASFLKPFSNKIENLTEKIQADFEDLERRNQKQVDRLLEMFKNNPEEALKYAIPLDEAGSGRGSDDNLIELGKRWGSFSLFSDRSGSAGGGFILPDDSYQRLRTQYSETAEELIKQKEYHKASFIFMKLLQNPYRAAQTLEDGKLYQEGAAIYLKYANNKPKAAECYEKGNMTIQAIDIYKELNQDEKVGDLYMTIRNKKEAFVYFEKVVDAHKQVGQFLKASLIYKQKMNSPLLGQGVLLEGWRSNRDSFNCLYNYFNNVEEEKERGLEIKKLYNETVDDSNRETFLTVIKYEFEKQNQLAEDIKNMAHELIVAQIHKNPNIVSELRSFDKTNKQLIKDTLRFKTNFRK